MQEVGDTTNDSLRAGLETPGWLAPSTYLGRIYIPNHADATLTKYATDESGSLIQEGVLSFASFGVSWVAPVFIAPDRAYMFDDASQTWMRPWAIARRAPRCGRAEAACISRPFMRSRRRSIRS